MIYLLLKLWDLFIKKSIRFVYVTFVFFEYSLLISGYLFFFPYIVFSISLNYKYSSFDHSYFTFSFVIAIFYFVIYVFSWFYFLIRLLGSNEFFTNPINYNRYYYFYCSMKKNKGARKYDIVISLFYFLYCMFIAIMSKEQLTQVILLFIISLIICFYLGCQRPYRY